MDDNINQSNIKEPLVADASPMTEEIDLEAAIGRGLRNGRAEEADGHVVETTTTTSSCHKDHHQSFLYFQRQLTDNAAALAFLFVTFWLVHYRCNGYGAIFVATVGFLSTTPAMGSVAWDNLALGMLMTGYAWFCHETIFHLVDWSAVVAPWMFEFLFYGVASMGLAYSLNFMSRCIRSWFDVFLAVLLVGYLWLCYKTAGHLQLFRDLEDMDVGVPAGGMMMYPASYSTHHYEHYQMQ